MDAFLKDVDLSLFEKNLVLRLLRMEDYEQVVQLQLNCFQGMWPWSREQIASQLRVFPEGQICIEHQHQIIASSSSLILDFDVYGESHNWLEISDAGHIRNHNPSGNTLYGIEVMVDPRFRGMKLARRLYDARKKLARERNLMRIVLGGRIPGYAQHRNDMSAEEYVEKVLNKTLYDPVLTMQISNGFIFKRLIQSYMFFDEESLGYGTLLEWINQDCEPHFATAVP
jgi:ribosomal protein S18 acetylase RimI-like enzyme